MKKTPKKYVGSSPMKFVQFIPLALSVGSSIVKGVRAGRQRGEAEKQRDASQALFDQQLDAYKSEVYRNPYEDMRNVYENMTVDQRAAEFQQQQYAQSQADALQGLRGVGGAAGAAALAQAMSRQGAKQAREASLDIGAQERRIQQNQLAEERALQIAKIQGDQQVLQQERARTANLASMYGQQTQQAQLEYDAANQALGSAITSGVTSLGQSFLPGGVMSNALSGIGGGPQIQLSAEQMPTSTFSQLSSVNDNLVDIGEEEDNVEDSFLI